ncbi:HAD-IIB family hydrolase [Psychrobacillus sp. MER TA 171]|uniref:HAD-IIB family hydrolase n=1 Tax=Psychrobacillus sp. MER TA 171 TaxID=2939577 RepID=UPI00203BC68E|nr:HAD-IIB family hydrolase [Psychrobacillus sp. MER TA 171]MCM3357157.1 HAD family hydrolase [Psychrobacillus sp. MER TA 171]
MQMITQMLATDLDGTFVGDEKHLKELLTYYEGLEKKVTLVYVTGRHRQSAIELMKEANIPVPSILISDVGTGIYIGKDLKPDEQWNLLMKKNWNPEAIKKIASNYPTIVQQKLPNESRISYTVQEDEASVKKFKQELLEANISHKFIFSSGRDIDILPENSGKGSALTYVIEKYVDDNASILIAGDSGNDEEMISLGYPSVIVANAQPELMDIQDHPQLFRATKNCAGGIHEAWLHFYNN